MSINALSNAALARRTDFEPLNAVPTNLAEIAAAAGGAPPRPVRTTPDGGPGPAAGGTSTSTALQTVTTYIPTEVLTLYIAAVAAIGPWTVNGQPVGRWAPFFAFLVATPLLPNTPFAQFPNWYSAGLASFLVLIVSSGLGIVAPLMQRPLTP